MGRLGNRTPLDPHVPATMARQAAEPPARRRGLRRRGHHGEAAAATRAAVELVDYSVTGISFTAPPGVELHANEVCTLAMDGTESRVRVVWSHEVDGAVVWGAMFLDPRPDLVLTIESTALHRDVAGEEARWNSRHD